MAPASQSWPIQQTDRRLANPQGPVYPLAAGEFKSLAKKIWFASGSIERKAGRRPETRRQRAAPLSGMRSLFFALALAQLPEIHFDRVAVLGRHVAGDFLHGAGAVFVGQLAPVLGQALEPFGIHLART